MRDSRRTRVVLAVLLVLSLSLVALNVRGASGGPLAGLSSLGDSVLGPVENAFSTVTSPIRNGLDSLRSGSDKDARIADLEAEIQQLRASGAGADARRRLAELDALLRTAGAGQYRIVAARVIAVGPAQGLAWTVTIDAGTKDKLTPDMTVIVGAGLVGRVVSVSPTTSTVALLIDPTTSVGARIEGSGQIGFLFGTGQKNTLQFQLLDAFAPMKTGDRLVTFGSKGGKPYVPGVPIGEVVSVKGTPGQTTRLASVRPYVDFTSLDLVGVVIVAPRTNPRDSVLPPKPKASASASGTPSAGASGSPSPGTTAAPSGSGAPSASRSPQDGASPTGSP